MIQQLEVGTYIFLLLVCTVVFVTGLFRPPRNERNPDFLLTCLFVLGWYSCELIRSTAATIPVYTYSICLGLVFMEFAAATVFFFAISFYRLPFKPSLATRWFIYSFPIATAFVAHIPKFNVLVVDFSSIPKSMSDFIFAVKPWFWAHTAYCYLLVLLTAGVVLFGHIRIPKFYKFSSTLMVFGIILIPLVHIVSLSGYWTLPVAPLAFALCIAVVLSHFALEKNDQNVFVHYARGYVFRYLNEYILILSKTGRVTDCNPSASAWFGAQGIDLISRTLQDILDSLSEKGADIQPGPENQVSTDISITVGAFPVVLNLRVYEMADDQKKQIGSIAVFSDVTENRALMGRLEEKAGMDHLTGLANRTAYVGAKNRLDSPAHFPLSVIVCDINGLKKVNDKYGHRYGDMMLQVIGETLEALCPKPGFLARIGGDEFIYLLPRTDAEAAEALMKQVREALLFKSKDYLFGLSVAMGASVKSLEEEDLDSVIDQADNLMYQDKKRYKKSKVAG